MKLHLGTAAVVAAVALAPSTGVGQGLAKAAQKEKERRAEVQSKGGASKSYSDDNRPVPAPDPSASPSGPQSKTDGARSRDGAQPLTPQEQKRRGGREATERAERSARAIKVTVYVTSWCQYCRKTLAFLATVPSISVTAHDIERERGKEAAMLALTGGRPGVPVVDVEGIIVGGYSPDGITAAIATARSR